ncbi:MAG: hypothetical protein ACI8QC_000383 [Planctomycetota bacterium]|jgi:hypothetical protein
MTDQVLEVEELSKLGKFDRVLDRSTDWANAILVKEVRQALRGRFFRIAFSLVLLALCMATTAYIMDASVLGGNRQGRDLFNGIYGWLGAALFGLVPFGTFASMGNEWDENTFDLLVLSNLKPWQIIWGKLLSAGVQSLLYLATFTPFLACAFLMQGVDLFALCLVLVTSFLWSLALSVLALALSTLSKTRFSRIFMMAVLAGALSVSYGIAMSASIEMVRRPDSLGGNEFWMVVAAFASGILYVAAFLFCLASNSLAHPEENRSTNLRVVCSLGLLFGMSWLAYMLQLHPDADALSMGCIFLLMVGLVIPSLLFISEPNPMGRRVAFRVPQGAVGSLLSVPWLPGGGRGVLFFLLHAAGLVLYYLVLGLLFLNPVRGEIMDNGAFAFLGIVLYLTGYMLIPAGLLSATLHRMPMRIMARLGAPLLMGFLFFLPAIVSFLFGGGRHISMRHVGNPASFIEEQWNGMQSGGWWLALGLFAGLALLLNLPRAIQGYLEVGRVRAARIEHK